MGVSRTHGTILNLCFGSFRHETKFEKMWNIWKCDTRTVYLRGENGKIASSCPTFPLLKLDYCFSKFMRFKAGKINRVPVTKYTVIDWVASTFYLTLTNSTFLVAIDTFLV